ncbi:MAG: M6 family metalloprotease domain-containing protein, partial [Endomicrobium sp.]|nr:M6 family metalloprotease domain-containing protein [Endomicrobium sp.]
MRQLLRKIILALFAIMCARGIIFAVSANPEPFSYIQPDGTKITLNVRGDEFYNWTEDKDGYSVIRDANTRQWHYARLANDGSLEQTSYVVGKDSPLSLGVRKHLKRSDFKTIEQSKRLSMHKENNADKVKQKIQSIAAQNYAQEKSAQRSALQKTPSQITYKHLVILVAFSDKPFRLTNPKQAFENFFNQTGYNTDGAVGSVKDFYDKTSYGTLNVESIVTDIVTVSSPSAYYAGSSGTQYPREMVREALTKLNSSSFNFKQFDDDGDRAVDFITVIHSGGGMESGVSGAIWSHKWNVSPTFTTWDGVRISIYNTIPELRGSNENAGLITRIGVSCHELGHAMLGLPDLYDTTGASEGVGNFCLMGGGSWNGGDGKSPSLLSAWSKKTSGFITPIAITSSGYYSIGTAANSDNVFFKFSGSSFNSKEYFLIENRYGASFDAGLPGPNRGILIWHIDDNKYDNDTASHYLVDLEEADGSNELSNGNTTRGRDSFYFRSGNKTVFNSSSNPNNKNYSGTPADVDISSISSAGQTMSFYAYVAGSMEITSLSTTFGEAGTNVSFSVLGNNFRAGAQAALEKGGSVINASVSFVSSLRLDVSVQIPSNASTGNWDLVITDIDDNTVRADEIFTIETIGEL